MKQLGRIGMGLIGPGFIAPHHIDAVRRLGDVDVIAIAGSSAASAEKKAREYGVGRFYGDYKELIADPEIQVVHNTTPSYLHFPVSMAALEAGKHVISDKPLAIDPEQCRRLRDAAAAAGVVNAVTFNYRGNPLVQQARAMIAGDEIGRVVFIHGHYLQDWMTSDKVYSWRSDPAKGGVSSALADIGSHWCDLAEHTSGQRITAVLADLTTVVKTRYSAGASAEAFVSASDGERTPVEVTSEDLASVLLRFDNGAKGCLTVGQVLPGHKNNLEIELNGRTASLRWNQEHQNELWVGRQDQAQYGAGEGSCAAAARGAQLCASARRPSGGVGRRVPQCDRGCVSVYSRGCRMCSGAGDLVHLRGRDAYLARRRCHAAQPCAGRRVAVGGDGRRQQ